jgi:selenide,water dikinase
MSNREASRAAVQAGASAATDITGFGLLGHLTEMIAPRHLGATVHLQRVPVLDAVRRLPPMVGHTAWINANLEYARSHGRLVGVLGVEDVVALLDPQTSGGLLVAVSPNEVGQLERKGFTNIGAVTEHPGTEVLK